MKMTEFKRWSLERRLVKRIALAYAALVLVSGAVLLVGLWFAGLARDNDGRSASTIIADSLAIDPQGQLSIRQSTDVKLILDSDPSFWAVAQTGDGKVALLGQVPAHAARGLDRMAPPAGAERTSVWNKADDDDPAWSAFRRQTSAGPATIAVKLGRVLTWPELIGLIGLGWIFFALPFAGLPALLAVPFLRLIIRRTLQPLSRLATQASAIDFEQRSIRLADGGEPQEVRPLVDAINSALDRLEAGYARQTQFLADAAHELRTPIAIIKTRLDGAPRDVVNDALRRDTDRLASMAEQLLTLEQLKMTEPDQQVINLSATARNIVADFAPMIIGQNGSIAFEGDLDVQVTGDQLAIERALVNLVQNAIDHGGPNITVEVHGPAITVRDDGEGVPAAEQDGIFEPFHRLRPRHAGAGLGLALVRQIIRQHGGTISINTSHDDGFAITLHFPGNG